MAKICNIQGGGVAQWSQTTKLLVTYVGPE